MLGVSACSGVMDQELRAQVVANNHEVVMGAQAALLVVANLFHQTIQKGKTRACCARQQEGKW